LFINVYFVYCRYPAQAIFYSDRLEYTFHHPFQAAEVHLVLSYKDMNHLTLATNPAPGKMYFRVPRKLVHFARDFDPTKHFVVLYLSSSASLHSLRENVMPLIQSLAGNLAGAGTAGGGLGSGINMNGMNGMNGMNSGDMNINRVGVRGAW
jgi:hypothetical protein